jgi:hypothetical protein
MLGFKKQLNSLEKEAKKHADQAIWCNGILLQTEFSGKMHLNLNNFSSERTWEGRWASSTARRPRLVSHIQYWFNCID